MATILLVWEAAYLEGHSKFQGAAAGNGRSIIHLPYIYGLRLPILDAFTGSCSGLLYSSYIALFPGFDTHKAGVE